MARFNRATTVRSTTVLSGRYRLTDLLGRGGMAEVYRAEDLVLHRPVAVKVFGFAPSDGPERRRIDGEMRTFAALDHPNLVTVHDAGVTTDEVTPYLVMELVRGPSLEQLIAKRQLTAVEVAEIGREIASALAYVHQSGVVHRDVKPANILLGSTTHGQVAKLADFGIAMTDEKANLTAEGMTIGTANYLSPEQVRGEKVLPASDVYSFGLVLIECLSGAKAYPGVGLEAAIARLQRPPEIPVGPWAPLLSAMTAEDPRHRPAAKDVVLRIPQQDGHLAPTAILSAQTSKGSTALLSRRPPRRKTPLIAAVAAVAGLLLGGFLIAGQKSDPPAPAPAYPTVPGKLGSDLKDLQEAVG